MAIYFPIVSSFDSKGVKRAMKEFKSLEGAGAKTGYLLKKSFMPAVAGLAAVGAGAAALGVGLFKAAQAAAADQKSTMQLNKQLQAFAKVSVADTKANNEFIDSLQLATGVADDELRPALARLVRGTKNLQKGQRLLKLALDISGRTGKDLATITEALGKAADGSTTSLFKLGIGFSKAELKGKSLDELVATMEQRFKGGAADAANTFEGRLARVKIAMGELYEKVGYKLLRFFERALDAINAVAAGFDESGLAGAIQAFRGQMNGLNYDKSSIGKFFRNAYDGVKLFYDSLVDTHNFLTQVTGMQAVDWTLSKLTGSERNIQKFDYMKSFDERFSVPVPVMGPYLPGTRPSASRLPGGQVIVNNYSADPNAVVRALQTASRRNGSIGGIRYS